MTDPVLNPPPARSEPRPPAPRWVKLSLVFLLVLVAVVVGMMAFGGGEHGPGRHGIGGSAPTSISAGTAAAW